jgi:DNA-binding NtrC family response regulator
MMIVVAEKTTDLAGSCILVVDDDDGVRENLAELFEMVGYSILTAGSAAEALKQLANHNVDVLLTDYRMPGPNGVELIEAARRMKPGLRAILMTAFGDSFTEIESVRRGAIGYVNKPFEADEITNLISRILGLKGE